MESQQQIQLRIQIKEAKEGGPVYKNFISPDPSGKN